MLMKPSDWRASLVQLYTALVYKGPGLINALMMALPSARPDGLQNISDAAGIDNRGNANAECGYAGLLLRKPE